MTLNSTKQLAKMAIMLALLIISPRIAIPLPLLDYITLQIVIVYLLTPILGLRDGLKVSFSYLILGLLGLPVFAAGGGLYYVLKPTFGFLLVFSIFPLVQFFLRKLFRKVSNPIQIFISNYISLLFIHLVGVIYKIFILNIITINGIEQFKSILEFSTLIDFSSDLILVTLVSLIEIFIYKYNKKILYF